MAGAPGVLVVSGDGGTVEVLGRILRELDSEAHFASTNAEAAAIARDHPLTAVIADVRRAGEAPQEILRMMRRHTSAPVVMLTDDDSNLAGQCLELGAEDCIRWPVTPRELKARIRLRSAAGVGNGSRLELDRRNRTVECDGMTVSLTDREFELLSFMAASPGVAFSCDQLLDAVWGSSRAWQSFSTIREHIYRLRNKLEKDPGDPQLIVTVRGHGYRLEG